MQGRAEGFRLEDQTSDQRRRETTEQQLELTPQKKTPVSVAGCLSATRAKMRSQLGRPYCSATKHSAGESARLSLFVWCLEHQSAMDD